MADSSRGIFSEISTKLAISEAFSEVPVRMNCWLTVKEGRAKPIHVHAAKMTLILNLDRIRESCLLVGEGLEESVDQRVTNQVPGSCILELHIG